MDGPVRVLLVVLLGKAELARVAVTVPSVAEPEVIPPVPVDRVLSFVLRHASHGPGGDHA